jgi:hypothetical protein
MPTAATCLSRRPLSGRLFGALHDRNWADTCRCRVALLVRLLVARTSGYQVASLVQDLAKRLILLHSSPKPPGSEAERGYKARSEPPLPFAAVCIPMQRIATPIGESVR